MGGRSAYNRHMLTELGHFALILAFAVAILQATLPLIGAWRRDAGWMAMAEPAATTQFLLIAFSFGALMWAFVVSDFSLQLVVLNSHSAKPMLYKISGTWGNHEGSMLLWVLIVALFGATAAWFGGNLPLDQTDFTVFYFQSSNAPGVHTTTCIKLGNLFWFGKTRSMRMSRNGNFKVVF